MFQFYDSPIKRTGRENMEQKQAGFNSMIVRLKAGNLNLSLADAVFSFNSMIVRLKEERAEPVQRRNKVFQFYDSPIKRSITTPAGPSGELVSIL